MTNGNSVWLNIYLGIISVLVPVISAYVVNYLKTRLGNENLKKYYAIAETAVKAAESMFVGAKQGISKKADVATYLHNKIGKALSVDDIERLIEAAVYELNKTGKGIILNSAPTATYTPTTIPLTHPSWIASPDIPSPTVGAGG